MPGFFSPWSKRFLIAAIAIAVGSTTARGEVDPSATAKPAKKKKGSYTRWPLPAAGESVSGDPELIFTFDDGPHERFTAEILDQLAEHHIKAIFFWVGHRVMTKSRHLERRLQLVRRAVREGHIVVTHTVDHLHLCHLTPAKAAAQIDQAMAVYTELTGLPATPLFRTPYGDHCPKLLRLLAERGLTHLHWDIDPMEWTDNDFKRVAGTLRRKFAKTKSRAVVLIHDTHFASAAALPIALDWLDAENQRRVASGQHPIRILSGSDLAAERLDPEIAGWVGATLAEARTGLGSALASLVP